MIEFNAATSSIYTLEQELTLLAAFLPELLKEISIQAAQTEG